MRRTYTYLPQTLDAASVLGLQVAAARRTRRTTAKDLAERAHIDQKTLRKIEQGDPTVAVGTVFEVATLVGVDLFGVDPASLRAVVRREQDRVALLPSRIVRPRRDPDNDF